MQYLICGEIIRESQFYSSSSHFVLQGTKGNQFPLASGGYSRQNVDTPVSSNCQKYSILKKPGYDWLSKIAFAPDILVLQYRF
jgi:hypothetical protein